MHSSAQFPPRRGRFGAAIAAVVALVGLSLGAAAPAYADGVTPNLQLVDETGAPLSGVEFLLTSSSDCRANTGAVYADSQGNIVVPSAGTWYVAPFDIAGFVWMCDGFTVDADGGVTSVTSPNADDVYDNGGAVAPDTRLLHFTQFGHLHVTVPAELQHPDTMLWAWMWDGSSWSQVSAGYQLDGVSTVDVFVQHTGYYAFYIESDTDSSAQPYLLPQFSYYAGHGDAYTSGIGGSPDDGYYAVDFTSDDPTNNPDGHGDVASVTLPSPQAAGWIAGDITDATSGDPVDADVTIYDAGHPTTQVDNGSTSSGHYSFKVAAGASYLVEADGDLNHGAEYYSESGAVPSAADASAVPVAAGATATADIALPAASSLTVNLTRGGAAYAGNVFLLPADSLDARHGELAAGPTASFGDLTPQDYELIVEDPVTGTALPIATVGGSAPAGTPPVCGVTIPQANLGAAIAVDVAASGSCASSPLATGSGTVTGTVSNYAAAGGALTATLFNVQWMGNDGPTLLPVASAPVSTADGSFTITGVGAVGAYGVLVSAPDSSPLFSVFASLDESSNLVLQDASTPLPPHAFTPSLTDTVADNASIALGSFALPGAVFAHGTVTSGGAPAAGACVYGYVELDSDETFETGCATTGSDGTYRVKLPLADAAHQGTYELALTGGGLNDQDYPGNPLTFTTAGTDYGPYDFAATAAASVIVGTVTDGHNRANPTAFTDGGILLLQGTTVLDAFPLTSEFVTTVPDLDGYTTSANVDGSLFTFPSDDALGGGGCGCGDPADGLAAGHYTLEIVNNDGKVLPVKFAQTASLSNPNDLPAPIGNADGSSALCSVDANLAAGDLLFFVNTFVDPTDTTTCAQSSGGSSGSGGHHGSGGSGGSGPSGSVGGSSSQPSSAPTDQPTAAPTDVPTDTPAPVPSDSSTPVAAPTPPPAPAGPDFTWLLWVLVAIVIIAILGLIAWLLLRRR